MASQRAFSNKSSINYNYYYYDHALPFVKIGRASDLIIYLELKKQNLHSLSDMSMLHVHAKYYISGY